MERQRERRLQEFALTYTPDPDPSGEMLQAKPVECITLAFSSIVKSSVTALLLCLPHHPAPFVNRPLYRVSTC